MKRAYLDDSRIADTIQAVIAHDGEEKTLQVPVFDPKYLDAGNCSGYVRLAAEKLYGKQYSYPCPTWQRKHNDKFWKLLESGYGDYGDKEKGLFAYWFLVQEQLN